MQDTAAIESALERIFREQLQVEVPSADTDLIAAGVLDSLKFVDLLLQLEQQFGAQISLDELELDRFRTLRKIADFLVQRNGTGPGPKTT